jgi:hypothetical protein
LAGVGVEDLEGVDPGGVLRVIEFTEIQQRLLMDVRGIGTADIFDDTEVAMEFAILLAGGGTEEHGERSMPAWAEGAQGGRSSLRADFGWGGVSFRRKMGRTPRDFFHFAVQYRKLG